MSVQKEKVKSWLPVIRQVRRDMGIDESLYSDETILALIEIESGGDPYANRAGSQFHGILQMGRDAGRDVGMPDKGRLTTQKLLGDGEESIRSFLNYQERYASLHNYDPEYIALLWKGGPRTVKAYKRHLRESGEAQAKRYLQGLWGGSPVEYLRRFRNNYEFWGGGEGEMISLASSTHAGTTSGKGLSSTKRAPSGAFLFRSSRTVSSACDVESLSQGERFSRQSSADMVKAYALVSQYLSSNFIEDLGAFAETVYVRGLTSSSPQWSSEDLKVVQGFIEDVQSDLGTYTSFQMSLADIGLNFCKPLVNPVVRNPWGQRRAYAPGGITDDNMIRHPETGEIMHRHHLGVDYETRPSHGGQGVEQPCYAVAPGIVRVARTVSFYGKAIYIEHANGVSTRYAHLSTINVRDGQQVEKGQFIGRCGTSSTRDGVLHMEAVRIPHLHFELRINVGSLRSGEMQGGITSNTLNISINPEPLFAAAPNPGEVLQDTPPALVILRKAREQYAQVALTSNIPGEASKAFFNYDKVTAMHRGETLARMDRASFYRAQALNTASQTKDIQ